MFYLDDKIWAYPKKSVVEDVLTREGDTDRTCFTPYKGMKYLMKEQLSSAPVRITVDEIINSGKDFDPRKSRPTDEGVDREEAASSIKEGNYYTRLEDIDDSWVERYIRNLIVGFKLNNNGQRSLEYNLKTYDYIVDEEDGDLVDAADVLPELEDFSHEDILAAKEELPYLLRTLHKGSIEMRASLLSLIIAFEQWRKETRASGGVANAKPSDLFNREIYKVNARGELTERFTARANTTTEFAYIKEWIWGYHPNDPYYKAYKRLMTVLTILDVDITKEDVKRYTPEVMDSMLCTFVQSNSEYIAQYGLVDKRIMKLLAVDQLFAVQQKFEDQVIEERDCVKPFEKAQQIILNAATLRERVDAFKKDKPEAVNKFLRYYYENISRNKKDVGPTPLQQYSVRNSIVCNREGTRALVFDASGLKLPGVKFVILSVSGNLIALGQSEFVIDYMTVGDAIALYRREMAYGNWKTADL